MSDSLTNWLYESTHESTLIKSTKTSKNPTDTFQFSCNWTTLNHLVQMTTPFFFPEILLSLYIFACSFSVTFTDFLFLCSKYCCFSEFWIRRSFIFTLHSFLVLSPSLTVRLPLQHRVVSQGPDPGTQLSTQYHSPCTFPRDASNGTCPGTKLALASHPAYILLFLLLMKVTWPISSCFINLYHHPLLHSHLPPSLL